ARVVPRWAVVRAAAPLRDAPAALLLAVRCRVERALLDPERFVGPLLEPARDRVAVHRPPGQGSEHEHVERALQEFESHRSSHRRSMGRCGAAAAGSRDLLRAVEEVEADGAGARRAGPGGRAGPGRGFVSSYAGATRPAVGWPGGGARRGGGGGGGGGGRVAVRRAGALERVRCGARSKARRARRWRG